MRTGFVAAGKRLPDFRNQETIPRQPLSPFLQTICTCPGPRFTTPKWRARSVCRVPVWGSSNPHAIHPPVEPIRCLDERRAKRACSPPGSLEHQSSQTKDPPPGPTPRAGSFRYVGTRCQALLIPDHNHTPRSLPTPTPNLNQTSGPGPSSLCRGAVIANSAATLVGKRAGGVAESPPWG